MEDEKNLEILCTLTASNKLVPFLGAGCSKSILQCDWDSLMAELNIKQVKEKTNPEVAQLYVDLNGKEKLCETLRNYLLVDGFDAEKGYIHTAIMVSMSNTIYTTNQDNVMEKCMEFYGRKIYPIVKLDDLVNAMPDGVSYFKFHGDLSDPDSVIFSTCDYQNRINGPETFLDIRLKADLLGKNFLFIGYSFRDDNIKYIFDYLHKRFPDKLAKSYLISYNIDKKLEKECNKYSIKMIVPAYMYPKMSKEDAFEKFLFEWNCKTFFKKTGEQLNSVLNPAIPNPVRIVAPVEVKILEENIDKMPLEEAVEKFRHVVDRGSILPTLEPRVAEMFYSMCKRCQDDVCALQLEGASFNLCLKDRNLRLNQAVYTLVLGNVNKNAMHLIPSMYQGFPKELSVLIGAYSIDVLRNNNIDITSKFQQQLSNLINFSVGYKSFNNNEIIRFMEEQYAWAWIHPKTTLENPLRRQERLGNAERCEVDTVSFGDIFQSLISKFPKSKNI